MQIPATTTPPFFIKAPASIRRFFHWLTSIRVVLSLIMLVLMFIMVVIPLYSLIETTVTYSQHDLTRVPEATVGGSPDKGIDGRRITGPGCYRV